MFICVLFHRMIDGLHHELKPLVQLDPLLLPMLVYICPNHELPKLLLIIPTYLSVAWLYELVDPHGQYSSNALTTNEVSVK